MSTSSENWRQQQREAGRAVHLTLHNASSRTLYRTNYSLAYGIWSFFPPEKIQPHTTVDFGSQSFGFCQGTEGSVSYGFTPPATQSNPDFLFQWFNPFWGTRKSTHSCPPAFQIKETAFYEHFSEIKWVCEEKTASYTPPIQKSGLLAPSNHERSSSTPALLPSAPDRPKSPSLPEKAPQWKKDVASAIRSVHVIIDNRTETMLRRRDQELQTGTWGALPPEEIPPFSRVEFGAFASNLFSACQGILHFNVLLAEGSSHGNSAIMKGDFTVKWDIPVVGYRSYHTWIPSPFFLESTCVGSARILLTIFVLQPSVSTKEPDSSPVSVIGLTRQRAFKVMTFNSSLHPPVVLNNDPMGRSHLISDRLNRCEADVLCLQGVFHPPTRNVLESELKAVYPYIIDQGPKRQLKNSGAFFASKFPILRHEFRMFSQGIGGDALLQKGMLGVKLDLSSMVPNKVLFVFSIHLQASPDSSLAWKLIGNAAVRAQETRMAQLQAVHSFIMEWVRAEDINKRKSGDAAFILAGDFNIEAEAPHPQAAEIQYALNTNLPKLSSLINNKIVSLRTVASLMDLLTEHAIPVTYLGLLRRSILSRRDRLIILIGMLSETIKQLIVEELRNLGANGRKSTPRLSRSLPSMPSLVQTEPEAASSPAASQPRILSDSSPPQTSEPLELTFMLITLEHYRALFQQSSLRNSQSEELVQYWKDCIRKLKNTFEDALFDSELHPSFDFTELVNLVKYQWITALELTVGVPLLSGSKLQLLKGDAVQLSQESLGDINWKSSSLLVNCFSKQTAIESVTKAQQAQPTGEYSALCSALSHPRDVFREKNKTLAGYTVDFAHNGQVKSSEQTRSDYIWCFDNVGVGVDGRRVHRLTCVECSVVPFGASPVTQLSDHFGVEATFSL